MRTSFHLATASSSRLAALLLVASALAASSVHGFNDADARSKSVYQLVTDRFAVTSSSGAPACNVSERAYCGGQWAAIGKHLSYIQGMGFDTSEFARLPRPEVL